MDFERYAIVGSTVRSYLSWLKEGGGLRLFLRIARPYRQRLEFSVAFALKMASPATKQAVKCETFGEIRQRFPVRRQPIFSYNAFSCAESEQRVLRSARTQTPRPLQALKLSRRGFSRLKSGCCRKYHKSQSGLFRRPADWRRRRKSSQSRRRWRRRKRRR